LLVPRKQFFSYSATEPYQPCTENVNYIVFSNQDVSLDIMSDSLTKLQSIILNNPYDIKTGPNLFLNDKGPTMSNNGEIYIDCQPVGSSNDTSEIVMDTYPSSSNDWLNNPVVKLLLGSLLFIIILYVVKYVLNMIKPVKYNQFQLQLNSK
jgi:hypothetical protein